MGRACLLGGVIMGPFKRILIIAALCVGTVAVASAGYAGYVFFSYSRIGDKSLSIDTGKGHNPQVEVGEVLSALTYNIGFGAFSPEYTYYKSTGYSETGKPTRGRLAKAYSKEAVETNVKGAINASINLSADFLFFQEVDFDASRSFNVDESKMIHEAFPSFDQANCVNQHTPYFPYPVYDREGYVSSGLVTLANRNLVEAARVELPTTEGIMKYFSQDDCLSVSSVNVSNGRHLYLANVQLANAEANVREKQMERIREFLFAIRTKNDYVVMGGDWGRDLLTHNPEYPEYNQLKPFDQTKRYPDWMDYFFVRSGELPFGEAFKIVASDNVPNWRNSDIAWEPSKTFAGTTDGFIVSDNVLVLSHRNIQTGDGFLYSDHEPAYLEFKLLG